MGTEFVAPKDTKRLLPTFTHSFTPNDPDDPHASDKVSDSDALQNLEYGILRQFQRMRNNEVCEARGGDCKKLLDLFGKYFKMPGTIPNDIYESLKYANDLN